MQAFINAFRSRFDDATSRGDRTRIAKAASVRPEEVSRWGKRDPRTGNWQVPTIFEIFSAAKALDVSPAWLAFGIEPREARLLDGAIAFAVRLEKAPALRKLISDYEALDTESKELVARMTDQLRSTLPPELQTPGDIAANFPDQVALREFLKGQEHARIPLPPELQALEMPPKEPPLPPELENLRRHGDLPPGFVPVENRPRRANRRDELAVYDVTIRKDRKHVAIPHWLDLAAGPGCELERCEDIWYFRNLPDWEKHHSATIRGDSMTDTLRPGDIVVLRAFDTPPTLEVLENESMKAPLNRVRAEVPHDAIAVLSINNDPPTLKRVKYQHGSNGDWLMQIVADNPFAENFPYTVRRDDTIVFYALLKGIAQGHKEWKK